ncbi:hypothetical protein G9A89_019113 [Geosiphon pyriformis]|nr:hypothetical protein G9A89_019113 [Geosiphon pyriformis]
MAGLKNDMEIFFNIITLAFVLAVGFLLVILSCALYSNWWPLFVVAIFVLAPIPNIIFSSRAGNEEILSDNTPNGFKDFSQFLTAVLLVTGFCLPYVLAHSGAITYIAMVMSIGGGAFVYITIIAYLHFFANQGDDF